MQFETVGIVGLGLMGRGIATVLLAHNIRVVAIDPNVESHSYTEKHIEISLPDLPEAANITWRDRFIASTNFAELVDCQFVIESIPEEPELKQQVLGQIEAAVAANVPIATNTSALPISLLQSACQQPERVIGMHWGEPCHLTRFLEIIRGQQTDDTTTAATISVGTQVGKDPTVVKKDVPGFIVNRLAYAMYREAFWLVENDVADVETIDRAFTNAISIWADIAGPFRWMDMTGLAAYGQAMKRLFPELSCEKSVPKMMQQLVDSGAQGTANCRGFYNYTPEEADQWRARWVANTKRTRELADLNYPSAKDPA
ncbi:3-hydroxyacyl-CoA dehydrogenase family protein [Bremerella cremea]|uniref:3-hydroxyacyl-CoA dehydrogenase n=1 Tax=Blastopirellula marina TaxID=124 RepID=A0A2S8FC22_9BACT|nr:MULTISPECIES: 3-hydroxyacyl-CoA dehydrogenase family protein [Pirellulaceae]PQO29697.1 3-hydroxyacyl-CoA dehydrogenase [Blastopirellula marina]RCS42999.1 3-hydroxyacyl-CoA dehydrogenase family protein [Bremerella cremea]